MSYIGITEDRLHHIIGVARKCYSLAKEQGYNEDFCRKMWMIGWNHDVGYEFSETQEEHPEVSSEMIHQLIYSKIIYDQQLPAKTNYAVFYHSQITDDSLLCNPEWVILSAADLLIDSKGNEVNVGTRLNDIKNRYGVESKQFYAACDIAVRLGLIEF